MDYNNLPSPLEDVKYNITSIEYLLNMKVIEFLWLICPEQRIVSFSSLSFKLDFIKSNIEKNPNQEKEIEKEFKDWVTKYTNDNNVIWYFLEQSYGLTLKEFIKGFPSEMKRLKKQDSFIKNVTHDQQLFLNIFLESSICKAIANNKRPSNWDFFKIERQLMKIEECKHWSKIVIDIHFRIIKFEMFKFFDPNNTLVEIQEYVSKSFGDYIFEANNHYSFYYLCQTGILNNIVEVPEINSENEPSIEIELGRKIDIQLPKIKQRLANDGITSLSLNQTALFFNMLRNEKIIFKDESYQTKENIYKAIQEIGRAHV